MCGIFGAINLTGKFDESIIKGLAWANRQRGTDSIGFFDSSARVIKRVGDPCYALSDGKLQNWLSNSAKYAWAIGGHTRFATQGKVTKRNAHPFQYGDIVGSHNGMVDAPHRYEVDSEVLFDTINREGYQGIESIPGYWGLSWYDKSTDTFYLTMHDGSLAYTVYRGVCYYSSDSDHLGTMVNSDIYNISEGQVLAFDSAGNVKDSEQGDIESIQPYYHYYGKYNCTGTKNTASVVKNTYLPDCEQLPFDTNSNLFEDWNEYIHSMSDDNYANWESGLDA